MEEISFDDVEEVINNFQGLNKTMHYMMMEKTEKFDISPDQTRLLFMLQNHQNINQNALAKKLNITKAGEVFIEAAIKIMKEKTMIMFEGVSKEQITVINDVINIMKKNIEKCKGEE